MAERRKRRKWSDEEKCRIVAQTKVPGVSVPQVAHRYDVNANLIFKWVRVDPYRFSGECLLLEFEFNRRKEWVSEEHRNLEPRLCALP